MSKEGEPRHTTPEAEPRSIVMSVRYPTEEASQQPYMDAQQLIFDHEDLSMAAFRLKLRRLDTMHEDWFVAVIGDHPSLDYVEQFRRILSTGEDAVLPPEVLMALWHRRLELAIQSERAENHYGTNGRRLL